MRALARLMGPLARRLYPEVPPDHPAMGSLLVAMSANLLGLGNACTPLGLKAMGQLQELNRDKETASDAMCTFMAVTSSSLTVIPTTIIALRLTHGSLNPTDIIGPIAAATCCSTVITIVLDSLLRRLTHRRRLP